MNRVFLEDDRLAVSTATDRLTDILDGRRLDDLPTLMDSQPHSILARQLDGDTISVAFLPPRLFRELQLGTRPWWGICGG